MLHIFSTSRAIRKYHSSFKDDTLLPQTITIADFEAKATYVPHLIRADDDTRVLLMGECCQQEAFSTLHIPKKFLAFLNNSNYLFRFFEELAQEGKSCDDLRGADVYGEFEEHLAILEVLQENYSKKLEENGFYDTITFPKKYHLNTHFLSNFSQIYLHLDGYLNNFEWELFNKITQYRQVNIFLQTNNYNQKMVELFKTANINLSKNAKYDINLNQKTFTCKEDKKSLPPIDVKSFHLRSLQIGYAFWQIEKMIKSGIKAENIALILPDESFMHLLKSYDKANNLNFAMGFPFSQTLFMQKLTSIIDAIENPSLATAFKDERLELEKSILEWKKIYKKNIPFETFKKMIYELGGLKKDEKKLLDEELFGLEKLFLRIELIFQDLLKLLVNRLKTKSVDDVRGGKITVLGALETRGAAFDGVVIVDFNDSFVPRLSQKDMFLSTKVRYHANLPTRYDRENLQRYYYYEIIKKAKKVAISYTKNEENLPSRFLNTLSFKEDNAFSQNSYSSLLLPTNEPKKLFTCKELIEENSLFNFPLSASRLRSFLECPRCYYFKYILQIKDEDMPSDELSPLDIGNALHVSLFELYSQNESFLDAKSLHVKLSALLDKVYLPSSLWEIEKEVWKNRLLLFCENEMKRFHEGWRPYKLEKRLEVEFNGVLLEGKIDRIDKHEDGSLAVIDYKSGKISLTSQRQIEAMSDFQMQFYTLLASTLGEVTECGFYDLAHGVVVQESFMEEKLKQLENVLDDLKKLPKIDFQSSEKTCKYTPYTILCHKDFIE